MSKNGQEQHVCVACAGTHKLDVHKPIWVQRSFKLALLALALLITGLYLEFFAGLQLAAQVFFILTALVAGKQTMLNAVRAIRKVRLDMTVLMTVAAVGAFGIGHGEEGAAVLFLFFIAEFLESYAEARSKRSIQSLLELAPDRAIVRRDGAEVELPVSDIKVGDTLLVKPGHRIALDGVVVVGSSFVNEAPITGESVPKPKHPGDMVFAGTLNTDGYLEVKVTKKEANTMLAKIKQLVERVSKQKSSSEIFVEKFARYYTPAVILSAILLVIIPVVFLGQPLEIWLYRALTMLVIACPCALVISTPVSMVSALTSSARNGVLVKGGRFLEQLSSIRHFAFDKTGTLTKGKIVVTDVINLQQASEKHLLSIALTLEKRSEHPIAKAILEYCEPRGVKERALQSFSSVPGKGVKGVIGNTEYFVGSPEFFRELGIKFPEERVSSLEACGKTVVMLGTNNTAIGLIAVSDEIKENAAETVSKLKALGIEPIMLTGDNEGAAKYIAKQLGIAHYHSRLSPEDKVKVVRNLTRQYGSVVMVGDGVNDAPALAQATVGIAMGAAGSDVAIESADVALMEDDLEKLVYLVKLSRKTNAKIKQNIFASILIKGTLGVLALFGLVSLWVAVAIGDLGLSLAVILNALSIGNR